MEPWTLAVLAALVLAYATFSGRLGPAGVTPAIAFVVLGFTAGADVLGLVDLSVQSEFVRLLAEATLSLILFADASRIDLGLLRRGYGVPGRLLLVGLPLTIAAGAAAALLLFPDALLGEAVILAIVLAPTDAALGQAVVTDERLPSPVRQGLNVESGLNDGICVPLLFIALAFAEADAGALSGSESLQLVAEAIGWGALGGLVAGAVAAFALRAARRVNSGTAWLRAIPVAGVALAYGLADPLGGSGFIAAFVAGLSFGALTPRRRLETSFVDETGDLLNALTFIIFGAVVLGTVLADLTWAVAAYALLSLTVVRMIPVAIAMLGSGARAPTVAFLGWFGPRGLASIVFAIIVLEESELPHLQPLLVTIFATVALSVFAHGLSAPALTDRYVRWRDARRGRGDLEAGEVEVSRARGPQRA